PRLQRRPRLAARGTATARRTVVVPFDAVLVAEGLADAHWLLHEALRSGARNVVVDLGAAPGLPPAVLSTLLWAHRVCRSRGGGVLLRGADGRTREMLHRTGLERVLRPEPGDAVA
ncbi:MAG: anti-sigma-factor antagonist, partial [Frankiales bacterium]|nr:anti-sigma-factor antagonist [Frankiales bacterium]